MNTLYRTIYFFGLEIRRFPPIFTNWCQFKLFATLTGNLKINRYYSIRNTSSISVGNPLWILNYCKTLDLLVEMVCPMCNYDVHVIFIATNDTNSKCSCTLQLHSSRCLNVYFTWSEVIQTIYKCICGQMLVPRNRKSFP